jgi:hypothetical protein
MVKNYDIEKDETNISDDPKENVKAVSGSLDKIQRILKDIKKKEFNLKDKEGKSIDLSSTINTAQADISSVKTDISSLQSTVSSLEEGTTVTWQLKQLTSDHTSAGFVNTLGFKNVANGTYRLSCNLILDITPDSSGNFDIDFHSAMYIPAQQATPGVLVSGEYNNTSGGAQSFGSSLTTTYPDNAHGRRYQTTTHGTVGDIAAEDANNSEWAWRDVKEYSLSTTAFAHATNFRVTAGGNRVFTVNLTPDEGSTVDLKFKLTETTGTVDLKAGSSGFRRTWALLEKLSSHTEDSDKWDNPS